MRLKCVKLNVSMDKRLLQTQSEQLYLYQTKKKLEERLSKLKLNVANQKKQFNKLAISSKENNIKKMQLKEEIADITAKNAICKLKTDDIERQIVLEKEIGKSIDDITPVKFSSYNGMEKSSMVALSAARSELEQKFYAVSNHTDNYDDSKFAMDDGKFDLFKSTMKVLQLVCQSKKITTS
ncbi:uncharacterized protein LOC129571473 isoform X2 [Sitodiplosis mosellana]|uniref:uncharacterized protein LOC129571473 isoform X2 n=1 Tax=Sitodiplosis mosellana TaxID=263140 RepID=UPI002444859A|nr:uncharacterized protein LOC129571473 isoform X2 [Sitodiplosis mosellana]